MPPSPLPLAEVGCRLAFDVPDRVDLALQVAVASSAGDRHEEELAVTLDGLAVDVIEVDVDGARTHVLACGAGRLTIAYRAVVEPRPADPPEVTAAERLVALRQSRYAPSDALTAFADAELRELPDGAARARAIGDWVFERLRYELGSSGPLDTAVDTLLASRGVCRDFAHLTVALARAVELPARLVSVYAPGLSPMDFHAVTEVVVDGRWQVIDATKLAPRQSLVRISTGRDAADTAFATTTTGSAELLEAEVMAVVHGDLPADEHQQVVFLP
ncbi:MAG: transglutaminase family protein [Acidimicrobiales bacterium]|nr:transglutaminase family protein [Acidimicrobiales bacterium]